MSSERASLQERLETSTGGRTLISAFLIVTLLAVLVTNLPDSQLRRTLSEKTQPYLNAIGLDQNWGVFAPDPRREAIGMKARIAYADGTTESWEPPVRNDLFGEYSDYRWQKYMENVINDGVGGTLSKRTALWVARNERSRAEAPARVALIKRFAALPPPGPRADDPLVFNEQRIASLKITPKLLREGIP